jgi:hypothetical protein
MKTFPLLILTCLAAALLGSTVHAQAIRVNELKDPGKSFERYVRFAFNGNLEDLLKQQIDLAKDAGPMKQMLESMLKDLNLNDLKGMDTNNPAFQKFLEGWKDKQAKEKNWSPDQLKKLMENMQKWTTKTNPVVDPNDPWQLNPMPVVPPKIELPQNVPDVGNAKEKLAEMAEKFMKDAESSNLGDWLRDSPAWKNAFEDLQGNFNAGDWAGKLGQGDWAGKWGGLTDKLRLPEKMAWNLGEGALNGLKNLPKPNLNKLNFNPPQFKGPNWAGPNFGGGPKLPNFGGGIPSISSNGVFAVLILIVAVLIAWQLWNLSRKRRPKTALATSIGPWPVDPHAVRTRAELVQAFDYLAILKLGLAAKPWNHRVVAEQWSKRLKQCRDAAQSLADLYETARYTTGDEALTAAERAEARATLAHLADASAA